MQLKNYLWILILLIFRGHAEAQENQIALGDKNYAKYDFIDAQEIYLKVAKKGYKSADLFKKLGNSYYFNADLKNAAIWYEALYTNYGDEIDTEYLFRYAQSLKNVERYKESDRIMKVFEERTGVEERRAELFSEEQNYLELIEMQSGRFRLSDVGINSANSDFAPSFYDGELVFASSRGGNGLSTVIHQWNELPFLDLYKVSVGSDNEGGSVSGLQRLKGKVNTRFHESSSVFTKDGKTLYFTRNNYTDSKLAEDEEGTILLKLYRSQLKNGKWGKAEELPFNSNTYSVAHPALSADESKLYFASDMPGGEGLSDLYVVNIEGNGFSEPKSLGENINTEGRETFPFVSQSGRLYFASDGHIGLGGLDVFVAVPTNTSFEKPINVGEPVNSQHDDFTFILEEESKMGYFASNRPGGLGNDDIYSFIQTEELLTRCKQTVVGQVTDAQTRTIIQNAEVQLLDQNNNQVSSTKVDAQGNYKFQVECSQTYVIRALHPDYQSTEVQLMTGGIFEKEHNQPLQLTKGQDLGITSANLGDDLFKILQLQPIYFDLDKSYIRPDAEVELQKVIAALQEYKTLKIDVRSHTDSRADDNYNMRLSERRARSTMKYIIDKGGIAPNRLSGRGYGEALLVNDCNNNTNCSEAQHQMNRRSEFIILE